MGILYRGGILNIGYIESGIQGLSMGNYRDAMTAKRQREVFVVEACEE